MANKLLINIIVANLLWSFIPIIISGLFQDVSIIMIIFIRFLISGIILLFLAFLIVILNNKVSKNEEIPLGLLLRNLFHKNRRFYDLKNIIYYGLLGFFGIILHIIFFFLTIKTTSISFTMSGFLISIILIAFYEKGVYFEKFDIFKVLYLVMLTFSIIILIAVSATGAILKGKPIGVNAIIYLLIFSVTISFLYISINNDAYSKEEIKTINEINIYKIPRLLIKMSFSFLLGTLLMIPFVFIIFLIPVQTDLTFEVIQFFQQLPQFIRIMSRWEIIFLIIFSTIIPYLLVYIANANWKATYLTYTQWSSILNLIDPLGSLIFAVVLVNEYFPYEYLIIVIFFFSITIIFRYAHEVKNLVQAIALLNLKKGAISTIPTKILKYHGVQSAHALIGTNDLLVNIKISSIKDFYYLINNRLKPIREVNNLEILFINKQEK